MNDKYRKAYCKDLIEYMSKGYSFESFASITNCSIRTLHNWKKIHDEFQDAYEVGHAKRLAFFETCMLMKATGSSSSKVNVKDVNWRAVEFALKTLYSPIYSIQSNDEGAEVLRPSDEEISAAKAIQELLTPEQKFKLLEGIKEGIRKKRST